MNFKFKLGFVGFGNMATAISNGIIKSNIINANQIAFFDLSQEAIKRGESMGMCPQENLNELSNNCEYIFFAVKPQMFHDVATQIEKKDLNVISIMAGITISKIKSYFPNAIVARAMPNTPALVGEGMSGVDCSQYDEKSQAFIMSIFNCFGASITIKESQINEVIAVSGSGPAYVYMFMKGMFEKAIELGFDEENAKQLVTATVIGSAKMFKESDVDIDTLTDRVCSKGGTTIEAVKVFKADGLTKLVDKGITACYDRAKEMSAD